MVLNDAGGSKSGDAFEDSPPQSDSDRYADFNQSENLQIYDVDGTSLPKPFPGSSLLGYNDANLAKLVHVRVDQARRVLKRPPTADEATALAYWTAKQVSILSYGTPVGVACGLARTYSTAPSFRFPFFKPDLEKFNPRVFPTPQYTLATGVRAMTSWHALRMLAYGAVGNFVGTILFASYSMSVVSIGEITDGRLKDYIAAIKDVAQKAHGALPNRPQEPAISDTPAGLTGQEGDDAGPKSDTYLGTNDDNLSNKGWTSAGDSRTSQLPASKPTTGTAHRGNRPGPPVNKESSYQTAGFDDASPTGGRSVIDDVAPTESAWERIRRQGTSAAEPRETSEASAWQSSGQPRTAATGQSAWSQGATSSRSSPTPETETGFFESGNGQISAREAAQREFDERLERERQGENFDGRK